MVALCGASLQESSRNKRRYSSLAIENSANKRLQADSECSGYDNTGYKESVPENLPLTRSTHDNIVYIEFPHISLARINAVAIRQEHKSRFGELKMMAVGEYLHVRIEDLSHKPQFLAAIKEGPYTITVTEPCCPLHGQEMVISTSEQVMLLIINPSGLST